MPTPEPPVDGERAPLWTRSRHARLLAEGKLAGVDRFGDPVHLPAAPIGVYPGRQGKIEELRRRARRREELFHPLDADDADRPPGLADRPELRGDDLVTLKQVAELLGVGYKTLHRRVHRYGPPPEQPCRGPYPARWRWAVLRDWLQERFPVE